MVITFRSLAAAVKREDLNATCTSCFQRAIKCSCCESVWCFRCKEIRTPLSGCVVRVRPMVDVCDVATKPQDPAMQLPEAAE